MTFQEAFEKLKVQILRADTTGFSGHFAIQVNLTNKDCGGIFYIEWKDNTLYVEPYDYYDRNVIVSAMAGDLSRILEGRMNPQKALESGKLQTEGDAAVLMAVLNAMPAPAKKPAAKKPVAKKAAEKKTAVKKTVEKKAAEVAKKAAPVEKAVKDAVEKVKTEIKKAPAKKTTKK